MQGDDEVEARRERDRHPRAGRRTQLAPRPRPRGARARRSSTLRSGVSTRDARRPAPRRPRQPRLDSHLRKASLAAMSGTDGSGSALEWVPDGDYADIRYERSREPGIAKITINRPEVRNAFRPQTVIELSDAFTRAREDETRRGDRADRRGPRRVLLGRRPARARRQRLRERARRDRALPRHRPAPADPAHAQAGGRDGRGLRDRRRPRAARRLRPHDRRRERALRPDRPARRVLRRRLRREHPRRPDRPEAREGDLVPLPPVRRPPGARMGPRQRGRAARAARARDGRAGVARCSRSRPSRCAC